MKKMFERFKTVFVIVIAVLAALALLLFAYLNWGFFTSGIFKYSKNVLEFKPFGSMDVFDDGRDVYFEVVNGDCIKDESGNQIKIKTGEFIKQKNGNYIKLEDGSYAINSKGAYAAIESGHYNKLEDGTYVKDDKGKYIRIVKDEYVIESECVKYKKAQLFTLLGNGTWSPYDTNIFINRGLYEMELHDNTEKLVSRNGDTFVDKWVCDVCGGVNAANSNECNKHKICPDCNKVYSDNENLSKINKDGACSDCLKTKSVA